MRPRKTLKLEEDVRTVLVKALITRYSPLQGRKISAFDARKCIPTEAVLQWGRVQIPEGGDRMCCHKMIKPGSFSRDCTYVRVCLTIIVSHSPSDSMSLVCSTKPQSTAMRE